MDPQNLPRLSQASERVIAHAAEESKRLEHHFVGVEHLFLGLARELPELLNERSWRSRRSCRGSRGRCRRRSTTCATAHGATR